MRYSLLHFLGVGAEDLALSIHTHPTLSESIMEAAAGEVNVDSEGRLHVTGWYCPTTVENLQDNSLVSLVIWDPEADLGYQMSGEVEETREKAVLDGYGPTTEDTAHLPQVERELLVRIQDIFLFCHAPHTDRVMND